MWTSENRARYDRRKLRYPSDMTDAEWALTPENAIHNAAAYASFAAHVARGKDDRFGGGRQNE